MLETLRETFGDAATSRSALPVSRSRRRLQRMRAALCRGMQESKGAGRRVKGRKVREKLWRFQPSGACSRELQ
ncbi:hypothetical protein NDU88_002986 [Pleurodeles waltl]|uniref:Uncharacterized protein n=1 Tax=Pleurodeles waltl TaxID=8319 RepID=A0AAV7PGW7_PLEWA|nr:hypothetical protein NDU88_002986 [Pleurodeles waltl]